MKTFKRNNWTTEEVIQILNGMRLVDANGNETEKCKENNFALNLAIDEFHSFQVPENDPSAIAYCVEDKIIYHIGEILPR